MAENVGYATLSIIPSAKGLAANLEKQTRGDIGKAGRRAGQQYGDAVGKSAGSRLRAGLTKMLPAAGVLSTVGASLFKGFQRLNSLDQAEAKLTGLGHSAKNVDEIMKNALESVKGTAFGLDQAATTAAGAVAAGIEPGSALTQTLTAVADAAAIAGTSMGEMGAIFNKVATSNKVQGEVIAQLGDRGIPIVQLLAKELGVAASEVMELSRKGEIGFAEFQAAMEAGMGGAAQKTGETFTGALANMQAAAGRIGANLLSGVFPKMTAGLSSMTGALSAMEPAAKGVGEGLGRLIDGFNALPGPVKSAAGALVAFRAASALGVTSFVGSRFAALRRGLDDVRLRASLAATEYRTLRTAQLGFVNGAPRFTAQAGRLTASLGAIRAGAAGAGSALRGAFSGLVGGPWGAALIGGTALVAKFWGEHQQAKAHVEALTEAMDKQTGALTKQNRELVKNALEQEGALKSAKAWGLNLEDVTDAALGSADALKRMDDQARAHIETLDGSLQNRAWRDYERTVRDAVGGQSDQIRQAAEAAKRLAEADGKVANAGDKLAQSQEKVTTKIRNYKGEIDKARGALQKLLDKENERRNKNLSAFQAETRLKQAMAEARKEADKGAKTLDASTQAGRDNRDALASLADAWNSAPEKVKRADGAYERMRQRFIKVAEQMGASREEARKLADRLVQVPKNVDPKFSTPGLEAARKRIKQLEEQLKRAHELSTIHLQVIGPGDISREEFGRGLGTRPYVPDGTGRRGKPSSGGTTNQTNINVERVVASNPNEFLRELEKRRRVAALGGAG